jgi:hypothetical protein
MEIAMNTNDGCPRNVSEDCHVNLYLSAFKESASRVRYVIFLIAVVTILIFVAYRNSRQDGWLNSRVRVAQAALAADADARFGKELIQAAKRLAELRGLDSEESRKKALDLIEELRMNNVFIVRMPLIGTAFDVNDLGLLSSICMVILYTILIFSLARHHENLFLALWKIKRVFDPETKEDGQSLANLLYHALAMAELFSTPPSLARWRWRGGFMLFSVAVFIPVVLQCSILVYDLRTIDYGLLISKSVAISSISIQAICVLVVLLLAICCFIYSRSMDIQWAATFYSINPSFEEFPQPSWWEWVRLRKFQMNYPAHLEKLRRKRKAETEAKHEKER